MNSFHITAALAEEHRADLARAAEHYRRATVTDREPGPIDRARRERRLGRTLRAAARPMQRRARST
jgi:hypothetical protein